MGECEDTRAVSLPGILGAHPETLLPPHLDGRAGVEDLLAAHQAISGVHGDGAHGVVANVLRYLQHQTACVPLHLQRTQDGGHAMVEAHIHHRPDHLRGGGRGMARSRLALL